MPLNTRGRQILLSLCVFLKSCQGFQNDATEEFTANMASASLFQESPSNVSLNRARNADRSADSRQQIDQSQVGCRELRSTKYISDGQCTSMNAVKELVCAGECLPTHLLPNWIGGGYTGRYWARRDAQEWRCVTDRTRTQRIRLQCHDGSTRTYKIAAVTSCKCKRYTRQHNVSAPKTQPTHVAKVKKNRGKSTAEAQGANEKRSNKAVLGVEIGSRP